MDNNGTDSNGVTDGNTSRNETMGAGDDGVRESGGTSEILLATIIVLVFLLLVAMTAIAVFAVLFWQKKRKKGEDNQVEPYTITVALYCELRSKGVLCRTVITLPSTERVEKRSTIPEPDVASTLRSSHHTSIPDNVYGYLEPDLYSSLTLTRSRDSVRLYQVH